MSFNVLLASGPVEQPIRKDSRSLFWTEYLYLLVVLAVWGGVCTVTWNAWVEPFVDFGRELYVPWQLAEGKVLYRDIAYFNGPVSPWWNAAWFRGFGASIRVLTRVNLCLSLAFSVFLYTLLRKRSSPITGAIICSVFISLFVFPQLTRNNAFNYIAPYSHEMTHGIYLAFLSLVLLVRFRISHRTCLLVLSGLCSGLVFMLKPELWLGLTTGIAAAAIIPPGTRSPGSRPGNRNHPFRAVIGWVVSASIPFTAAAVILMRNHSPSKAVSLASGAWRFILNDSVSNTAFYRFTSGTDDIPGNLLKVILHAGILVLLPGLGAVAQRCFGERLRGNRGVLPAAVIVLAAGIAIGTVFPRIPWHELIRGFPLLLILSIGYCLWLMVRYPGTAPALKSAAALPFLGFALVMLLKILLFARFYHYGFVLAMPAAVFLMLVSLDIVPAHLAFRRSGTVVYRTLLFLVIGCVTAGHLKPAYLNHLRKYDIVDRGANTFYTDQRGRYLDAILQAIDRHLEPGDTLAVLPQGAIVNFLTGHPSSVRHLVYMPTEIAMYGEAEIIKDFSEHPPDYILLRDRSTAEHGIRFGQDYAVNLVAWIREHTATVDTIFPPGPMGFFGVQLLQTKPPMESDR
ncbi:MAG TPA: hypothetical protein PLV45_05785 [bacterium]|nr:hypothetical protein [bacterium]